MVKALLTILLLYFIYRIIKIIMRIYFSTKERNTGDTINKSKQRKSKIDKKDIIEADFEEIKDQEKDNSQN